MPCAPPAIVVGSGFGCRVQAPALRAAGFEVVGLVGADRQRTAARAEMNGIGSAFTDLDQAIAKTGAIAVAIATPPDTHAALALASIARGCHVLCEKPFALNSAEARMMMEAAERAAIVHLVGHEFRWLPERVTLNRVIAQGLIGSPKFATFTSFIPYLVNPEVDVPIWWFDQGAGGGWLGAAGSHLIDNIRMLLGEFDTLSAALLNFSSDDSAADDTFVFRFRMKNGGEGVVQQTAAAFGDPLDVLRIVGTKGTTWMDATTVRFADGTNSRTIEPQASAALPSLPPVSSDPRQKSPKWQMLTRLELPPYLRLCQAFRARIEGQEPSGSVPLPTFKDGLASMQVIDAIRQSATAGGVLTTVPLP